MTRRTGQPAKEPVAVLEERVEALEEQVSTIAEAAGVLARGLEELPTTEPTGRPAAQAARRAHELLLLAQPHRRGPRADSARPGT